MKTQLQKNEKVVLTIKEHWFVLLKPIIWTLILLFIAKIVSNSDYGKFFYIGAGLTIIWFIYRILERKNTSWTVTNLRVIHETGVFSNNSNETPLDKINNVSYRQPLLGKMFNYGYILIQSAATFGAIALRRMIEKPKLLKDTITQYQGLYKQEQIKKQAQSLAETVGGQSQSEKIDISEELTKLHELKEKGIITEEDFQKKKDKILNN